MPKMPCPNCGSSEEFETLRDDKEKAHVRKNKPKWTRLNAYYRCSRGSCGGTSGWATCTTAVPSPSRRTDYRLLKSGPFVRERLIS